MKGLGFNAYNMTTYGISLDLEILAVEVVFIKNQSEIGLFGMDCEFGLEGDGGDADVPEGQQKVVIGEVDASTLEIFNGGKGDSIVSERGTSSKTGYKGSIGASTVNPDCPRASRYLLLKG